MFEAGALRIDQQDAASTVSCRTLDEAADAVQDDGQGLPGGYQFQQFLFTVEHRLGVLAIIDVGEQHIPLHHAAARVAEGLPANAKPAIDSIMAPDTRVEIVRQPLRDGSEMYGSDARDILGMD